MYENRLNRLKSILSIPTFFRQEHNLLKFLVERIKDKSYVYDIDTFGNLYITKGTANIYPCICAHTDSVHKLSKINIQHHKTNQKILIGVDDKGYRCGIGADDKAGVFVCMEMLEQLPAIKVVLFASEEFGCIGSQNSDPKFFENVGYIIEFDCPGSSDVTHRCNGIELFDIKGDFYSLVEPVLTEMMPNEVVLWNHPYTDVWPLKRNHNFSCINLATGYYDYHTKYENVVIDEVDNAIAMGIKCIEELGNKFYEFKPNLNESVEYDQVLDEIKRYYHKLFEYNPEPYRNILLNE